MNQQIKDFIGVDLLSPRLSQFVDAEGTQLLDAIIFGAGNAEVVMSGVAGQLRFSQEKTPKD